MIHRLLLLIITSILFGASSLASACEEAPSFDFDSMIKSVREEARGAIDACLTARSEGKEGSLTNIACPSGEFRLTTGETLSDGIIAYNIAVAVIFDKIDESVEKYMHSIESCRSKDSVTWTENIRKTLEGEGTKPGYQTWYQNVCAWNMVEDAVLRAKKDSNEKNYVTTSDMYPQQNACLVKAQAKMSAWTDLAHMLMSKGLAKSYQNDKDTFADLVKGAYKTLLEKLHSYVKILDRAFAKMTGYNRETNH